MSDPIPPPDPTTLDLDTVVHSFLEINPEPTDEQIHKLASLLSLPYEDFETHIYKMFGEEVEELDVNEEDNLEELEDELEDEDIDVDPVDVFLVSYFMFNPEPTDEHIHALAEMLDLDAEGIEERIYRMLNELSGSDPEDDDEVEIETDDEDFDFDDPTMLA